MSEYDWMQAIFLLMALVLPVSALVGHQLNWKRGFVLALAWAWIFVIVFLVILWAGH